MHVPKLKFPHISRLFSAILLWTGLVALFYINLYAQMQYKQPLVSLFDQTLVKPFSPQSHIISALSLKQLGFAGLAKRELTLAQDLSQKNPKGSVLGTSTDPSFILNSWETEPKKLQSSYTYWKMIITQKPDYRDGYIIAGLLAFQLNKPKEAKSLLTRARELDPNYTLVNTLLQKISE